MICKNCGKEVDSLDIICPHCKERLDDENLSVSEEKEGKPVMDVEKFLAFDKEEVPEKPKYTLSDDDGADESAKGKKQKTKDDEYEYYGDDDEEDSGFLSSKILVVILIILLIAAAGLAVKFLLFNDNGGVVDQGKPPVTEQPGDNNDDQQQPDDGQTEEPREMNISTAIDASEELNENIDVVQYNNSLGYDETEDYGISDINNAKTVDNIWKENGEIEYLDEAIIATLVKYNSTWIGLVNEGKQDIFAVLLKGSGAYDKISNFDRKDITEEFVLFEVGEIREGVDGYYVWTHEKIKVIDAEETVVKEYYWIYELVERNGKLYISNYYKY